MTINRNLRSLLLSGGIAVVAGLALSGCNRDNPGAVANAPTNAAATSNGAPTTVDPTAPGSPADATALADEPADNDVADMERHHKQAMDHAEMRGDGMKPDAVPATGSQAAPMKDM
jgi:hypothetical protein